MPGNGNIAFSAGNGTITFSSTLGANNNNLTLTADEINFTREVSGKKDLLLQTCHKRGSDRSRWL
jgi:hypothetical protein